MSAIVPPAALESYKQHLASEDGSKDMPDLEARLSRFQQWTETKLRKATRDDLVEFLGPLWSLRMWGNRAIYVDQVIDDNTLETTRSELATLLWGKAPIETRWDAFRSKVRRIGPAVMSELLTHFFPQKFIPWTGATQKAFLSLGIPHVPTQSYQVDGATYVRLSKIGADIAEEMRAAGIRDASVMTANYFIWWLNEHPETAAGRSTTSAASPEHLSKVPASPKAAGILHNDVRDKIADIGRWLGLRSQTEVKVANGAVVDVIWESTIGNMGRVIYVFEVQAKGSTDSLLMNLMKSLNNPAVQGVVAVSDGEQLKKIKQEAAGLRELRDKLKTWDYEKVLSVHRSLESVNSEINSLGLVPQGF